jgi:hypothetical protein
MRRRDLVTLLGSAVTIWPQTLRAQQGYEQLIPLLIELPGWMGALPVGTDEEAKGGNGISAGRSYIRGEAHFSAFIVSGVAALSAKSGVHIDVKAQKSTSTINGFQVTTQSTPVFVLISIALGPDAAFNLMFNNVSADEAMAIAQRFDWKRMQEVLNSRP